VQLHQQYAKDGLVCMSVSVDQPDNREEALKFLKGKKATFANYWLDEKLTFYQDKLEISGPPAVFVFDRQGKRVGKFSDDSEKPYGPEDIEKLVKELLKGS
jgi:hypothetical protein